MTNKSISVKKQVNKTKRMKGQQYLGFLTTPNQKVKQISKKPAKQIKSPCSSTGTACAKSKFRHCKKFDNDTSLQILKIFWGLNCEEKKKRTV